MSPDAASGPTSETAPPPAEPKPRPGLHDLLSQELVQIYGRSGNGRFTRGSLWGLVLSGGGIRSATFALGALQGLAHTGWLTSFHFVSSVSGGGYAASFLQGLLHRYDLETVRAKLAPPIPRPATTADASGQPSGESPRQAPGPEARADPSAITGATSPAILALRKFSNYLSPRNSPFGDRAGLVTHYLTNVVMVQLLLVPFLLAIMLVASLAYAGLVWAWPYSSAIVGLVFVLATLPTLGYMAGGDASRAARVGSAACVAITLSLAAMLVWPAGTPSLPTRVATYAVLMWAYALAYIHWTHCSLRAIDRKFDAGELLALLAGFAVIAGSIYGFGHVRLLSPKAPFLFTALAVGMPMLGAACFLAGTITLGLSPLTSQMDRNRYEQWADLSGKCALCMLLIITGLLLVFSPRPIGLWIKHGMDALNAATKLRIDWKVVFPILGALAAAAVLLSAGVWVMRQDAGDIAHRKRKSFQRTRRALVVVAPVLLVATILLGCSWILSAVLDFVGQPDKPEACGNQWVWRCQSYLVKDITAPGWWKLAALVAATFVIWYLLARKLAANPNEFSMNGFYRNRLVRCYLAATVKDRGDALFDPADDLRLSALLERPERKEPRTPRNERPLYPLLCCAVNLTTRKHLDWQDRKAASFVLSPLYCGHLTPRDERVDADDHRSASGDAYDIGDELRSMAQLRIEGRKRAEAAAAAAGEPRRRMARDILSPSRQADEITLGTAMAISGAAVSPNMGSRSSPMVTFLMTLLNARLGASVRNAYPLGKPKRGTLLSLFDELFGNTRGSANSAYLSDGGHFENIGIYELVRRRCRFVLCIDATADPERSFADLGNAIHLCRVDLGAEIDIDVLRMRPDPKTGLSRQCATVGKIVYADGKEGLLLYVKPCLLGDEPADITHYASEHPEFPHESTLDQYFDERQFEAYRHLGFVSCLRVLLEATERAEADVSSTRRARRREQRGPDGASANHLESPPPAEADVGSARFKPTGLDEHEKKSALLLHLRHRFFEPSDANALHFSRHGEAVNRVFQALRQNEKLASLDPFLYPGWPRDDRTPPPMFAPGTPEFRECFYFMQELIQLMESVYMDLQLEANYGHPDNRGWINLFRQWAWVPMFRLAWTLSAQTYGSRFVTFCETRLFVPDLVRLLRVSFDPKVGTPTSAFADVVAARRKRGDLNAVEEKLLQSQVLYASDATHWWLGVLKLDWKTVFATDGVPDVADALGLGFVVLSGEGEMPPTTLRLLRVQDHVRRMGLGTRFVSEVSAQFPTVETVRITPGVYGGIGRLSAAEASRQVTRITQMLEEARASARARKT